MLTLLSIAAVYGVWRATRAVLASLRDLPRCNEDMVYF
ncbi:Hypothetical protein Rta_00960 [Ramlibacter tataouinensis TTB310]|uniref:Uncharacterized protein n=1 Tax=Ramlibacter tataouinensis (strain ATCC BAA-407 / DSM 14655 / LMG 21543 / TTB310) TaxID=365046 RepID=F5Y370_RAMTT|nr:Hypothetical protein Rta_00960 [Ramlibacter tataouinensis TTB310]